jgi:hypothetical protein
MYESILSLAEWSMKRTLVLVIVLLMLITSPAYAQTNLGTSATVTNPQRNGDATTGLFSPAANTVAISSGGTEKIRVNGTGIGIGTTSPGYGLDVQIGTGTTFAGFGATWPVYIVADWPNVGLNAYYNGGWKFGAGSSGNYGGSIQLDPTTGQMDFLQSSTSGNANAAATMNYNMVINQNGRVGIGTATPLATLDLTSSSASVSAMNIHGNSATYWPAASIYFTDTGASGRTYAAGSRNGDGFSISDETAGTIRLVINSSGSVGIGTATPLATLDLLSISTSTPAMAVHGNSATYWPQVAIWFEDNAPSGRIYTIGNGGTTGTFAIGDQTAGTARLTINSSGSVGIGTASPQATLDVNSNSIIIEQSNTPADNATCTAGTHWWDANYIYVCTASGTVKRAALSAY